MNLLDCNMFKFLNKKLLTPSMVLKITHLTVRQKLKRKIKFTLSTFVNFSINEKFIHKHTVCLHHNIQISWFLWFIESPF